MTYRPTSDDIKAQRAHVSYVRIQEMVAERSGNPAKIAAARARYEAAERTLERAIYAHNNGDLDAVPYGC